ncbi:MAG: endonuclease/exonuclease/phosphatase family protein [Bacteroidota bacterium]
MSNLAGSVSISQSAIIQMFGLIYPILFFINFIFLLLWILTKSKLAFFPLLIILIGFGNIFDNYQMTVFNNTDNQPHQVKVLSYNVQNFKYELATHSYSENKEDIVDFLIVNKPDIVCLQEYHSMANLFYQPLKDIRDSLNATTYYYESYFNRKNNQLSGLVIFTKYKVVNKGKLKFDGSRTFSIYNDVIINMDTIRVFNVHLASTKLEPEDIDFVVNPEVEDRKALKNRSVEIYYKLAQAYQLREKQLKVLLKEIESTSYEIILCGDFNDAPSSWVYHQLTDKLDDSFVKKGMGISRTYAGPLPFLRIDYILTGRGFNTVGFTRHDIKKSDHYPISSIIEQVR